MRTSSWLAVPAASSVSLVMAMLGACGSASGGGEPMGSGARGGAAGTGGVDGSGGPLLTGGSAGTTLYDGGAAGDSGLEGCARASSAGEPVPVDIFVMLDKSGSMDPVSNDAEAGPPPWASVTHAITEFMALPGTAGMGMGLGLFPVPPSFVPLQCSVPQDCLPYSEICISGQCLANLGQTDSCVSQDYRKPAVGIDQLPGVAAAINSAMSSADVDGATPMAPALWGALEYAAQWSSDHPTHAVLVVLATDGYPTQCVPQEIDDIAAIAEGAATQHGLRTFVIGIGTKLTDLNLIAQKGGTQEAIMVDTGNAGTEFLAALDKIRGSVGCIYEIPEPEEGEADPALVNVRFSPNAGTTELYPYVDSEGQCADDKGWYYDNPTDPQQIILCPASCDQVQDMPGVINVVVGCRSVVK